MQSHKLTLASSFAWGILPLCLCLFFLAVSFQEPRFLQDTGWGILLQIVAAPLAVAMIPVLGVVAFVEIRRAKKSNRLAAVAPFRPRAKAS